MATCVLPTPGACELGSILGATPPLTARPARAKVMMRRDARSSRSRLRAERAAGKCSADDDRLAPPAALAATAMPEDVAAIWASSPKPPLRTMSSSLAACSVVTGLSEEESSSARS